MDFDLYHVEVDFDLYQLDVDVDLYQVYMNFDALLRPSTPVCALHALTPLYALVRTERETARSQRNDLTAPESSVRERGRVEAQRINSVSKDQSSLNTCYAHSKRLMAQGPSSVSMFAPKGLRLTDSVTLSCVGFDRHRYDQQCDR